MATASCSPTAARGREVGLAHHQDLRGRRPAAPARRRTGRRARSLPVASMSRHTTSTSASVARARSLVRSPSSVRGLWMPGVSSSTSCEVGRRPHAPDLRARGLRAVGDDRHLGPDDAVHQRGLADVGPTDERDEPRAVLGHWPAGGASATDSACSSTASSDGGRERRDAHGDDPVTLHALGPELEVLEAHDLALVGHVAEQVEDEPADRVPLRVGQLDAELLAHLVDRRAAGHPQRAVAQPLDRGHLDVVLVGDLPDDLLEQVFERHEPGGAAVLVDHDRHVELLGAHLAQQLGDPLLLGHEDRRAHRDPHRLRRPRRRALGARGP